MGTQKSDNPEKNAKASTEGEEEKKESDPKKVPPPLPKDPDTILADMFVSVWKIMHQALPSKDVRSFSKAVRTLTVIRHKNRKQGPNVFLWLYSDSVIKGDSPNPTISRLRKMISESVMASPSPVKEEVEKMGEGEVQPEYSTSFPPVKKEEIDKVIPPSLLAAIRADCPAEVDVFMGLVAVMYLIDMKQGNQALALVELMVGSVIRPLVTLEGRRTMDALAAKVYFYWSRCYEMAGRLEEIRNSLLEAHRTACLHNDISQQATILNLLLRNYLTYNLYEQANKLVSKSSFPDDRSNSELARYLYYIGRIKAVQLEYSEAHSKLMQAIRKAPQGSHGLGFRLAATKISVVVEMLIGGVPERNVFQDPDMKPFLTPYMDITQAVRSGDLKDFKNRFLQHEEVFERDGNLALVRRLHHSVIKTGLKAINTSYSRIHLNDVAKKLGLSSVSELEAVAAKAIVDGVIDASIDHESQHLASNWSEDLYCTPEPQRQLQKRIDFCMQLHQDAVKAMKYPDDLNITSELETRAAERKKKQAAIEAGDEDDDIDIF